MTAFDSLQRASFGNVSFPVESCHVKSTLRRHLHEYPPAAGAAVEKMGRTPYTIEMLGNFQATFKGYPKLWPEGLAILRNAFENSRTMDLVIPTVGTIKAYLTEWDQNAEAKIRSGEKCVLKFEEEFENQFIKSKLAQISASNIAAANTKFESLYSQNKPVPSLFTQITDMANKVLAIKDQADLQQSLIESKIAALTALLNEADRQVEELQNPDNSKLLAAMLDLWSSVVDISQNLASTIIPPRLYRVPQTMNTSEISAAVYNGDGSRGGELLALNVIEDPFAIKAGTLIRYSLDLNQAA